MTFKEKFEELRKEFAEKTPAGARILSRSFY